MPVEIADRVSEYLTDTECRPSPSARGSETSQLAARDEGPSRSRRNGGASTLGSSTSAVIWYGATIRALEGLLQLPDNWDRCGAPRIDIDIAKGVMSLLSSVMRDDTPAPSVVPTTRGGIQFEWHTRGIDLEVEFLSSVRVRGLFEDLRNGDAWDEDLSVNLAPLTEAIASLSRA